jgi:uncharacterized membrane protein YbhN (UPF0104 family)
MSDATATARDGRQRFRSILVNAALTIIALVLLGMAVASNRTQIQGVLSREIDLRLLGLAFGVYLCALLLTFVRWYVLVRALDLPFRLRDAMRLGFIGNVFNLVIPGAVGGDVIKAAFLCREQDRKTQAVASMVIDRALGLLGLFLLAGVSGLLAWNSSTEGVHRLVQIVWAAAMIGILGLVFLFTPALFHLFQRIAAGRGRLEVLFNELGIMAASYRRRLGVVALGLGMAVLSHSLFVICFYIVDKALFPVSVPTLRDHFLMVPLALFTTAVPLPFGALGLSEQVSEQLFKLVQHPSGAVAMMGFRLMMYGGGLVSVIVYLFNLSQIKQLSESGSESSAAPARGGSNPHENPPAVEPITDEPPCAEDGGRRDDRSEETAERVARDVGAEPVM